MQLVVGKKGLLVQLRGQDLSLLSEEVRNYLSEHAQCRFCGETFTEQHGQCELARDYLSSRRIGNDSVDPWIADYYVPRKMWYEASKLLKKYNKEVKRKGIREKRIDKVPGKVQTAQALEAHLNKLYPGLGIDVAGITIGPIKEPPSRHTRKLYDFRSAFNTTDSKQHGYLKWFAWNWILKGDWYQVVYEFPVHLYLEHKYADLYTPNLIRQLPGEPAVRLIADVAGLSFTENMTLVECGITTTRSMVLPLVADHPAQSVVWIPYINGDRNKHWEDFSQDVPAFQIKLAY